MRRLCSLLLLALAACSQAPGYVDDEGFVDLAEGKADGLLDEAPVIAFGETKTGVLGPDELDVFRVDLIQGQEIRIKQKVTTGDLAPHFTLFHGPWTKLSSTTFNRTTKTITKTYTVSATGPHFIALKPYQGNGSGSYELSISCTAVCEGNEVPEPLDVEDIEQCIIKTRECAFASFPFANMDEDAARELWERCLEQQDTCQDACDHEHGEYLCEEEIGLLPYYGGASSECRAQFTTCMPECADNVWGTYDPEDLSETTEAMCISGGFNGNCDSYARGHADCTSGGYQDDTAEQCWEYCESTTGALHDDLDGLCDECGDDPRDE